MKSLLEEILVASEMPTTNGVKTCNCSQCRAERQRLYATKTQPCAQCGHADTGSRNGFSESAFEFEDAPSIVQTEWNNSAIIRAKYSIGDYTKLSAKVKSWVGTGAVSYIETAIQEWDAASSSVKSHFKDNDTNKLNFDGLGLDDRRSYINLKRLYMKEGISNPLNYIRDNIVSVTFLGRKTPAHKDLQAKLDNAARLMSSRGYSFSYSYWGFVPRTFNNGKHLSNHALGKAIDFDRNNNPHIVNDNVRIVISNVCKDVLMKGFTRATKSNILLDAVKDPTVLREASDYFKANYDENRHTTAAISSIERGDLRKYQKTGFLNLDPAFIKIMQEVGFEWGGAWTSAKDFMHFELTGGLTATSASPPSTTAPSTLGGGESPRVLQNRSNAQTLGWGVYYDQINDLILPYSGQSGVSLGGETFAYAVARWQRANGFSQQESDGVIESKTWGQMKAALGISTRPQTLKSTVTPTVGTTTATNVSDKTRNSIGWKNNNPGNLRDNNIHWNGKIGADKGYIKFETFAYGLRAMTKLVINYVKIYHLRTVAEIINRYAPPFENRTTEYIRFVSDGRPDWRPNPDDKSEMYRVISKMVKMEIGYDLPQNQFDQAWGML